MSSTRPRELGRSARTRNSSTTTSSTRAATSPPGSSRRSFLKRSEPRSNHSADRTAPRTARSVRAVHHSNFLNIKPKEIAMSVETVALRFRELVNQGKHFEVMRTMYAPEMVSVEANGKEYVGKEQVIRKSEVWQGNNNIHGGKLLGPFFSGDPNASSGQIGRASCRERGSLEVG